MLSAAELASLRATVEASLPDTAAIHRPNRVSDGQGEYKEGTPATIAVATVKCRVSPAGKSAEERIIADRLGQAMAWAITVPPETDVKRTDRVIVNGRTFEVAQILGPRSYEVSRRVVAIELS